jgi:MFS family permease
MQVVTHEAPAHTGNVRALLAGRGFRRLLGVRLSSQLGDGVFQAALASSVLFNPERATTAVAVAIGFAVLLVPYSTLGPFVGVVLDRWSRRQVLFLASAMRAALVVPAVWSLWHGEVGPTFIGVALGIIALNRFFLAGLSASQPHVVDQPRLVTANSFANTAGTVCYSSGLALSGVAVRLIGTGYHPYSLVAATAALWYAVAAALTLVSFRVDALGPDDADRVRGSVFGALADTGRGMIAGIAHLRDLPAAWSIIVVQAVLRGLYGVLAMMTLLLYRNFYTTDDPAASMQGLLPVVAVIGVGAFVAAVVTPPATRRFGGRRWVVILLGALAVLLPALGAPFEPALTIAAAGAFGLATQAVKIVTDTTLQVYCEDDYRGRVFSINDTALNLCFVIGMFLAAILVPQDGHSVGVTLGVGGGCAALAIWYGFFSSRLAIHNLSSS